MRKIILMLLIIAGILHLWRMHERMRIASEYPMPALGEHSHFQQSAWATGEGPAVAVTLPYPTTPGGYIIISCYAERRGAVLAYKIIKTATEQTSICMIDGDGHIAVTEAEYEKPKGDSQ